MKIERTMNLGQLAEHMGTAATREDARQMRALLIVEYNGWDVAQVPEDVWHRFFDEIVFTDFPAG